MMPFDPMEEDEDLDPVTGQPYRPNTPRDPEDPREKVKTYLAQKMAAEKNMATPEFRQANRAPMNELQDSNRDLAMGKLLMNSANQMGTMGGKAASTKGFDEFSDQMMAQNQMAGQNILRERQEATASDDRQGKMLQYLADKYQSAEDKAAALGLQKEKMAKDDAYKQEMLGLKRQEVANAGKKASGAGEGVKALDKDFAKDYNDWTQTGRGAVEKSLKAFDDAIVKLEKTKGQTLSPTGRIMGNIPEMFRSEDSLTLQQDIHEAQQGGLKASLGSQFTAKEGEGVLKRSFDPRLSADENIRKIKLEKARIKNNGELMELKAKYFEQNGTLAGFQDPRPPVNYDDPAPTTETPPPPAAPRTAPGPAPVPAAPGAKKPVTEMSDEELRRELGE